MTFAEKVISFNKNLEFKGELPDKVSVMNPFRENKNAFEISSAFYKKYYNDNNPRKLILGINPGRFGAGVTGIPFTDTKRLVEKCKIEFPELSTHEPSSVFVYQVIDAYGGVEKFYNDFYINSLSPLGYLIKNKKGNEVNYNYYDSPELIEKTKPFIVSTLKEQISFGIQTKVCFCLGTGKNYKFLQKLNNELQLFEQIIPLEHPRYVVQYKLKDTNKYIRKFIEAFNES